MDKLTMTGAVMLGLLMHEEPRQGWELWEQFVEPRDAGRYELFKKTVGDLESRGHLKRSKPAKATARNLSLAKSLWQVTSEGQNWWDQEGVELYGPGAKETVPEPPISKWLSGEKMSREQWTMMMKRVREGKFQVAFRPSSDVESQDKRR